VTTATVSTGGYGNLDHDVGRVWTYHLDNTNSTVQALQRRRNAARQLHSDHQRRHAPNRDHHNYRSNDAPVISGDDQLALLQGLSTTITTADFNVTDVDNATAQFTFHVGTTTHGHVALSGAPGVAISSFTQAQLVAGSVIFVQDATQNRRRTSPAFATDAA